MYSVGASGSTYTTGGHYGYCLSDYGTSCRNDPFYLKSPATCGSGNDLGGCKCPSGFTPIVMSAQSAYNLVTCYKN